MTAAHLRIIVVTTLYRRACTSRELADVAGLPWNDDSRKRIHRAISTLGDAGYQIVNLNLPGSHRGGQYVLVRVPGCPVLAEHDPEFRVNVRVPLPVLRCGMPGCGTILARDHVLAGAHYCSPCVERMMRADLWLILGIRPGQEVMAI